jgi:hypothetical protein
VAELDVLMARFDQFDKRMDDRFQAVSTRLDDQRQAFDGRLADLGQRLNDLGQRLAGVENRLTAAENRMASNLTVNIWGATISMLIATAVAVIKLWT